VGDQLVYCSDICYSLQVDLDIGADGEVKVKKRRLSKKKKEWVLKQVLCFRNFTCTFAF